MNLDLLAGGHTVLASSFFFCETGVEFQQTSQHVGRRSAIITSRLVYVLLHLFLRHLGFTKVNQVTKKVFEIGKGREELRLGLNR